MRKALIFIGFVIALTNTAFAQAPENFKYQAVIRNSSGEIIQDQSVSIKISILQNSIEGTEVYSETHTVSTNKFGLVNLNIGDGNTSFNFLNIDWGSGTYFVKIELDASGGSNYTEIGTSQLLSVPYALYAKKSMESENAFSGNYYDLTERPNFYHHSSSPSFIQYRPFPETDSKGLCFGKYSNMDIYAITAYDWNQSSSYPQKLSIYGEHLYLNDAEGWNIYNVGIGVSRTTTPASKLEVANGDVFISDISKGVIMKSPNGNCWRLTVNDTGEIITAQITCPQGE